MWATGMPVTASSCRSFDGNSAPRPACPTSARCVSSRALRLSGRARRVEERGDVVGLGAARPRPARRRRARRCRATRWRPAESSTTWSISSSRIFGLTGTATAAGAADGGAQQEEAVAVGRGDHDTVAWCDLGLGWRRPSAPSGRRPPRRSGAARRRRPPPPAGRRRGHGEALEQRPQRQLTAPHEIEPVAQGHRSGLRARMTDSRRSATIAAMERLTGLDAGFLYMETPTQHMHTLKIAILDPSTVPGGYSFERVKEVLRERLHLLPPFRRRLVEVPFEPPPPGVDRGPRLRPRLPRAPRRGARARRPGGARRAHLPDRQPPARPPPRRSGRSGSSRGSSTATSASWPRSTTAWPTGSRRPSCW